MYGKILEFVYLDVFEFLNGRAEKNHDRNSDYGKPESPEMITAIGGTLILRKGTIPFFDKFYFT